MNAVFFDKHLTDADRRAQLYQGQLFAYSPSSSSLALCQFAAELAAEAFAPLDPRTAQDSLPVEQYAAILAKLKPGFIHHPKSKALIRGMLEEHGADLETTYFDVPRLRTATSSGYLTTGIAFAFHPHRDTWYSAPMCQLNWWLPVYEIEPDNSMAFHPRYWSQPLKNGSASYNYQEWVKTSRFIAAQQIGKDTRKQPTPEEPVELDPQIRIIAPVAGVTIFSGAQLHSSVPNQTGVTRFSIDFRTVDSQDVLARAGAPNIDSACTGTTLGDFLRASDLTHLPDEVIAAYL